MCRKVKLFVVMVFIFVSAVNLASLVYANEAAPPAQTAVQTGSRPGVVPSQEAEVPMDPGAHAVVPTDTFDFGSVYENTDIFHDFIIKNEGTADLKIINVKSG